MAKKSPTSPIKKGSPRSRRANWRATFLEILSETSNVTAAALAAGVDKKTAYNHRRDDPDFAEAWEDALDDATDALEAEARRRALRGVEEPVYQGGKKVGTIRKYSDTLLIFLLKGHRPERYRELNLAQLAEQIGRQQSVPALPDSVPSPPAEPSS